jgi:glycosyltransferase involved in cell wall biosynthesis
MESESCDLTIITTVLPEESDYILETDESVKKIKKKLLKAGISMEWIVVNDGENNIPNLKNADKIIINHSPQGMSISRNKALNESSGKWVMPLNAGDILLKETEDFMKHISSLPSDIGWVMSNEPPSININERQIASGKLTELFQKGVVHIRHPNHVIYQKNALLNDYLKGWINLPVNEDLGTLLIVSELYSGVIYDIPLIQPRVLNEQEGQSHIRKLNIPFSFDKISEVIGKIRTKNGRETINLSSDVA